MMQIKDIPKEHIEVLISAIAELRPDMNIRMISEDTALYKLGFVGYVPCSIEIEASDDEIEALVEEVQQMEIDAWNYDEQDLKNPEIAKRQKELEDQYSRYAIIERYLG